MASPRLIRSGQPCCAPGRSRRMEGRIRRPHETEARCSILPGMPVCRSMLSRVRGGVLPVCRQTARRRTRRRVGRVAPCRTSSIRGRPGSWQSSRNVRRMPASPKGAVPSRGDSVSAMRRSEGGAISDRGAVLGLCPLVTRLPGPDARPACAACQASAFRASSRPNPAATARRALSAPCARLPDGRGAASVGSGAPGAGAGGARSRGWHSSRAITAEHRSWTSAWQRRSADA